MNGDNAEVAIVGGGLVGAATAYFLAQHGVKSVVVLIFEIMHPPTV